jgi:hypothetical protein
LDWQYEVFQLDTRAKFLDSIPLDHVFLLR